jgi:hypothetical protein
VEFTVGRHAADTGAGVHPIVAAALQRRAAESPGTLQHARSRRPAAADGGGGGLGWPVPPPDGTGLGWPSDAQTDSTLAEPGAGALTVVAESPAPRRAGWRRLFGGAAAEKRRDTGAA